MKGSFCGASCQIARRPYWKKFTSIINRHEVRVFDLMAEVSRRVQAGKRPEIMNKVRLVEVAAGARDVRPLNGLPRSDLRQDLLKSLNAAKQVGRQFDLPAKLLDKVFVAHSDLIRDGANRQRVRRLEK